MNSKKMNIYEQELIEKEAIEKTAYNNKVFVACGAQAMKTQLNETGQVSHYLLWRLR